MTPTDRLEILGVRFAVVDLTSATTIITDWVAQGQPRYVCVQNVFGIMEANRRPEVMRVFNEASLTTPDGMPVVWIGRLLGRRDIDRVYGPDLLHELATEGARQGWRFFYYGGAEGVADKVAATIERRYPGVKTAGTYTPPFRPLTAHERTEVVEQINAARPDIVWVGISSPKQDLWMADIRGDLDAPVLVGVGAAFDFTIGRVRQAPKWMQRGGLEWLFRFAMEPRRLWRRYLVDNPRFVWKLLWRRPRVLPGEPDTPTT